MVIKGKYTYVYIISQIWTGWLIRILSLDTEMFKLQFKIKICPTPIQKKRNERLADHGRIQRDVTCIKM